jgi:hypothetical protein
MGPPLDGFSSPFPDPVDFHDQNVEDEKRQPDGLPFKKGFVRV